MFRHEQISTSSPLEDEEENECSWLLRSDETDSYDVIEVARRATGQSGQDKLILNLPSQLTVTNATIM